MAGTDSRFNADEFRSAIRFAMSMGFPEDEEKQITWQWDTARNFQTADATGAPFRWDTAPTTEIEIEDIIVLCAIKFSPNRARTSGTSLGRFDDADAEVTLLDDEFEVLMDHGSGRFPNKALIEDATYMVQFRGPAVGLFDVTVYTVYLEALDEV